MIVLKKQLIKYLALISIFLLPTIGQAEIIPEDDEWRWTLGAYLVTMNIEGDASNSVAGTAVTIPLDLSFSDILDMYEFIASGIVRYENDTWGVVADLSYIDLGISQTLGPNDGSQVNVSMSIREYELYGTYRVAPKNPFQVIAGVRYIDHDIDIDVSLAGGVLTGGIEIGDSWVDPFIGGQYLDYFGRSKNWFYLTRADIGGFGVGSDFTWRFNTGVGYDFGNGWNMISQYKILDIDFENGSPADSDYYKYDSTEHGILLGVSYSF